MIEILGYISAILMGVSLGLIGGGGSILTVPILLYFFRHDSLRATTGSLFIVGSTALIGAVLNARKGQIDLKTGIYFAVPSFVGVFFSRRLLLPSLPENIISYNDLSLTKSMLVLLCFAFLMILASRSMIRSGRKQGDEEKKSDLSSAKIKNLDILKKGFLVGCVTGFVGAGGGFLIIPALVLLLKVPMRIAIGTSLAIISANSLFGFAISFYEVVIDWRLLFSICSLGIVGIFVGQRYSNRVPEAKLKKGFGYFVLLIGSFILIDQIYRLW